MPDPNFGRYFEEDHAPHFYEDKGQLQEKYEFMRELFKRRKNELNTEKGKMTINQEKLP